MVGQLKASRWFFSARNSFAPRRREPQVRGLPGYSKRLEALRPRPLGDGVGHIDDGLRGLADRAGRDHLVRQRVDCGKTVLVLEADIDPRAVPRRPDAMRQLANRNGRYFRKIVRAVHLDLIAAAHRDICEFAIGIAQDVDKLWEMNGFYRLLK